MHIDVSFQFRNMQEQITEGGASGSICVDSIGTNESDVLAVNISVILTLDSSGESNLSESVKTV